MSAIVKLQKMLYTGDMPISSGEYAFFAVFTGISIASAQRTMNDFDFQPANSGDCPAEPPQTRLLTPLRVWGMFVFLLLVALGFSAWALCLRSAKLRISPETTGLTGPIDPKSGRLDIIGIVREISEPKCRPEDNGYRLLLVKWGLPDFGTDYPDIDRDRTLQLLYDRLDLGVAPYDREPFDWEAFVVQGTQDDFLDDLVEAFGKPNFFSPYLAETADDGYVFFEKSHIYNRTVASFLEPGRALAGRVETRIESGNLDGALSDLTALLRLGRHQRMAAEKETRMELESRFVEIAEAFLADPAVEPEAKARLRQAVRDVWPMPEPEVRIRLIELATLHGAYLFEDIPLPANLFRKEGSPRNPLLASVDWNIYARQARFNVKRFAEAYAEPDIEERDRKLAALLDELERKWEADRCSLLVVPRSRAIANYTTHNGIRIYSDAMLNDEAFEPKIAKLLEEGPEEKPL